jgi:hypothetical protein
MNKFYTEENLIAFYYQDCDLFTTLEIEHTLETDVEANNQYVEIYESIMKLDELKVSPSKKSINNILSYSTALR